MAFTTPVRSKTHFTWLYYPSEVNTPGAKPTQEPGLHAAKAMMVNCAFEKPPTPCLWHSARQHPENHAAKATCLGTQLRNAFGFFELLAAADGAWPCGMLWRFPNSESPAAYLPPPFVAQHSKGRPGRGSPGEREPFFDRVILPRRTYHGRSDHHRARFRYFGHRLPHIPPKTRSSAKLVRLVFT